MLRIVSHILSLSIALIFIISLCACGGKNTGDTTTPDTSPAPEVTGIIINEYCCKNTNIIYDSEGDYCDWVELYNTTDSSFSLSGYFLSDDEADTKKWAFPDNTVIEPKAFLLVFLSGKNRLGENGEIHASFKLGGDDEKILLLNNRGKTVDALEIMDLKENTSYGRSLHASQFFFFARPTPGAQNDTTGFTQLSMEIPFNEREVYISEVCAAFEIGNKDKTLYDWIELYNNTDKPVSLKGYGLCKSLGGAVHVFSKLSVPAHGYTVINASDKKTANEKKSDYYAPFTIDSAGEELYLLRPDGDLLDCFLSGKLRPGVTCGRSASAQRLFYDLPTPGKVNSTVKYNAYTAPPVFSSDGGFARAGDIVTISTKTKNAQIRYTTDGSEPTQNSQLYSAPLELRGTITLKATAFSDTLLPSDSVAATYIVDLNHTLPVVCISCQNDDLFSYENGILANGPGYRGDEFPYLGANFWKDWERKARIEYFADGKKELEFTAGICVFGQYSRAYDQKSLAIHLRDGYGISELTYPFFKGNPVTVVSDLVLRAGGQDQWKTKIRDPYCREVIEGYSNIASMDYQPVALYINGKYWGYYDLREKINESYFESHENIDKDAIDIVKGDYFELAGSMKRYKEMISYLKSHNIKDGSVYNYICSRMDVDNYIDYLIFEIFLANSDTGNIKFYRGYGKDDKFKWVIFDMDTSLSSFSVNGNFNALNSLFNPGGHGSGNNFSTFLQCTLIKNDTFRQKFISRYAELLNTAFMPERMTAILDKILNEADLEIKNASQRWPDDTYENWKFESDGLRTVVQKRREYAIKELRNFFDLSDEKMMELFPQG